MLNPEPDKIINKIIDKTRNDELTWRLITNGDQLPVPLAHSDTYPDFNNSYLSTANDLNFYLAYITRISGRDGSKFTGYELVISCNDDFYIPDIEQPSLYELATDIEFILNKESSILSKVNAFISD